MRWSLWRVWYSILCRSGYFKRLCPPGGSAHGCFAADLSCESPQAYYDYRSQQAPAFFFKPGQLPDRESLTAVAGLHGYDYPMRVADNICKGLFLFYSRRVFDLGSPVNWLKNPFSSATHHAGLHWSDYPTFSREHGDIKDVWEASRFGCSFWLVRAYAYSGDEKYPTFFWELFESWCRQNPVNMGPNWKCGQEAALRSLAWCFALYAFWESPSSTPERILQLVRMLAMHADRIEANIGYAISQKNNHALSEAAGLYTIGLLFPELQRAQTWRKKGRAVLEKQIMRQIYEDGSYIQHSMNYHRVMLHVLLWVMRLAGLHREPFPAACLQRFAKASSFLFQMHDPRTGTVPNYGFNDGALVLPLTPCDYTDFRPTIQACCHFAEGRKRLAGGPWDEILQWLFGSEALQAEEAWVPPVSARFDTGGYYTLRQEDSWCMLRCHSYCDRPAHIDMLHLDLWYKGVNVLSDSGSYRYYIPESTGLENFFKDIAAHNTIMIDNANPLGKIGKFLLLPWPRARCLSHRALSWHGEHYAYARSPWNVIHRRWVRATGPSSWEITDEILGSGKHTVALQWHLAPGALHMEASGKLKHTTEGCQAEISFAASEEFNATMCLGEETGVHTAGWMSRYYGEREKRPSVRVQGSFTLPARLTTSIMLSGDVK